MIKVENVTKKFDDFIALKIVKFQKAASMVLSAVMVLVKVHF